MIKQKSIKIFFGWETARSEGEESLLKEMSLFDGLAKITADIAGVPGV